MPSLIKLLPLVLLAATAALATPIVIPRDVAAHHPRDFHNHRGSHHRGVGHGRHRGHRGHGHHRRALTDLFTNFIPEKGVGGVGGDGGEAGDDYTGKGKGGNGGGGGPGGKGVWKAKQGGGPWHMEKREEYQHDGEGYYNKEKKGYGEERHGYEGQYEQPGYGSGYGKKHDGYPKHEVPMKKKKGTGQGGMGGAGGAGIYENGSRTEFEGLDTIVPSMEGVGAEGGAGGDGGDTGSPPVDLLGDLLGEGGLAGLATLFA